MLSRSLCAALLGVLVTVGSAEARELRLASWNMEWLTSRQEAVPPNVKVRTEEQFAAMRRYAAMLDADVIAVQEVDGAEIAAKVLPPEVYDLRFTDEKSDDGGPEVQRVGFAVRKSADITVKAVAPMSSLDRPSCGRTAREGLDMTLEVDGQPLRLLVVHLKSGCQRDPITVGNLCSCLTLSEQAQILQEWASRRQSEGVPFAILGDFNRVLEKDYNGKITGDSVWGAINRYGVKLHDAGFKRDTACWGAPHGPTFIDHVLLDDKAWKLAKEGTTFRECVFNEPKHDGTGLSDHCPVYVELTAGTSPGRVAATAAPAGWGVNEKWECRVPAIRQLSPGDKPGDSDGK